MYRSIFTIGLIILLFGVITTGIGELRSLEIPTDSSQFSQELKQISPIIISGVVVVKIKSATAAQSLANADTATGFSSLDTRLKQLGATSVQKMFCHTPIQPNSGIPDISRILKVRIPERMNPIRVARELERDPNVEYVEPVYVRKLCAIPNDPMYSQQHYLPQIHAPEA